MFRLFHSYTFDFLSILNEKSEQNRKSTLVRIHGYEEKVVQKPNLNVKAAVCVPNSKPDVIFELILRIYHPNLVRFFLLFTPSRLSYLEKLFADILVTI